MIFSPKVVAHYRELKAQAPDCLLLMQVGTFMEGWLKQTQGRSSQRPPPDKAETRTDQPLQLTLDGAPRQVEDTGR